MTQSIGSIVKPVFTHNEVKTKANQQVETEISHALSTIDNVSWRIVKLAVLNQLEQ